MPDDVYSASEVGSDNVRAHESLRKTFLGACSVSVSFEAGKDARCEKTSDRPCCLARSSATSIERSRRASSNVRCVCSERVRTSCSSCVRASHCACSTDCGVPTLNATLVRCAHIGLVLLQLQFPNLVLHLKQLKCDVISILG